MMTNLCRLADHPSDHGECAGLVYARPTDREPGPCACPCHRESAGSLEDILQHHLSDVEDEHALLLRMWNQPTAKSHEAKSPMDESHQVKNRKDDGAGSPDGPGGPGAGPELRTQTTPGQVTVLHQARALTAGDLRAALIGLPDEQPVAIDVPLDPGGLVLHRYVLTSTTAAVLLLADEDDVLDPSLVLRGDFPTGVYEIPTEIAAAEDQ